MKSPYQLYRMLREGKKAFLKYDQWSMHFSWLPRMTWGSSMKQVESKFRQPQRKPPHLGMPEKRWRFVQLFS